jgi:hypothetical protein
MPPRCPHRRTSFWLAVSAVIILPSIRAFPGLKNVDPEVGGAVFFVLLPLIWLYALGWTVSLLFRLYPKETAWWWVSIPYSLCFSLVVLASGGRIGMWFHPVSELFWLYYGASLISVVWTLLKVIKLTATHSISPTRGINTMFILGILASLSWILILKTGGPSP